MSDQDFLLEAVRQSADRCHEAMGRMAQADFQSAQAGKAKSAAESDLRKAQNEAVTALAALNFGPGFVNVVFDRMQDAR